MESKTKRRPQSTETTILRIFFPRMTCIIVLGLFFLYLARPAQSLELPRLVHAVGHTSWVNSITFSPDGRYTATAGGTVRLWQTESGAELRQLAGTRDVAFSPDGRTLLTGSSEGSAALWDIATGRLIRRLRADKVRSVTFSKDGRYAVTGGNDLTVRLWIVRSGTMRHSFKATGRGVSSVAISPDGRFVLAGVGSADYGGQDRPSPAILWSTETGREVRRFDHDNEVRDVSFSPDGRQVLTAGEDGTVRVWETTSGKEIRRFTGLGDRKIIVAFAAAFSPSGESVVLGTQRGAFLWEWRKLGKTGRQVSYRFTTSVGFSPDGRYLLTGGYHGRVEQRDLREANLRLLRSFGGHSATVSSIALSPKGRAIVTAGGDGVHLWNASTGAGVRHFKGHRGFVTSAAVSPDGALLFTGSTDGTARIWNIVTGVELQRFVVKDRSVDDVTSVAFSPDGRFVLAGIGESGRGLSGDARLWDVHSGAEVRRFEGHRFAVNDVAFSPDGRFVLTGSMDRTAVLWEAATGREIGRLRHAREQIDAVAFSPDGRLVATAGSLTGNGSVRIWNLSTGEELRRLDVYGVQSLSFSSDGHQLATGTSGGVVQLWDVANGRQRLRLKSHTDWVASIAFMPGDRVLLTASHDNTVRAWDARTGRELARLISFRDGGWAVVDPAGRYDASNGGDVEGLHWVVGLEAIELSQLKDRYYEPGLLAKVLGLNREPVREVEAFENPALYPTVEVDPPSSGDARIRIRLKNRGGGIGPVKVLLNGKEIAADARSAAADADAKELVLTMDLQDTYLVPGRENVIEVKAYNSEGYLSSRGVRVTYQAPGRVMDPPSLWAVVAGVSDYAGETLDLRFAAKDAVVMAAALRLGAARFFGEDRVHVELMTTAQGVEGAKEPTRANLARTMEEIAAAAKSTDILIVYLAGHGVTHGGVDGEYYYLTSEANSGNLKDPAVRNTRAVSSAELTEWIQQIPALKQVLILDTCQAGRVVDAITADRSVSSSQVRALERLKDRTGLFVLAGSAADAVSYEASRYGQGLLTYSLLLGMRGAALRQEEFVDVGRWFNHAVDRVPELARDIGGIQRPLLAAPRVAQSFDVGQLTAADRAQIPLANPKPLVLQSTFQDDQRLVDYLRLGSLVNGALREEAAGATGATLVFVEAAELPDAYALAGRYRVNASTVTVTVALFKAEQTHRFEVSGSTSDVSGLARKIVATVKRELIP